MRYHFYLCCVRMASIYACRGTTLKIIFQEIWQPLHHQYDQLKLASKVTAEKGGEVFFLRRVKGQNIAPNGPRFWLLSPLEAPKWVQDPGNGPQMIPPIAPDCFESIL